MRVCFFGAYDSNYPRNVVIKEGLRLNGAEVSECRIRPMYKFWLRYPLLVFRYVRSCRKNDILFVPEFCQKDVPLAKVFSLLSSKKVVFDPLAARFETKITDWKRKPPGSWQARWNFTIDRLAFRLSDLVLADTQAHKDYYCKEYRLRTEKVGVLPVGYDDRLYKPSPVMKSKKKFAVLFFGSFLPLHGADLIIRAAKIISSQDPSIEFKLIGSGQTFPAVRALASELGLNNILFEDWLAPDELPKRIASADICLGIFGVTEKAGRVVPHKIFQAMGMKKAVITAGTPAVQEFFTHRENIFLISETKPELLAESILELRRDESLRERIAEKAYKLVSENFSPRVIGLALIRILERNFRMRKNA